MFVEIEKVKIFVRVGFTDMRKQINGLSIITQEIMEEDPFSGNLFLFCNKSRNILKCLYWDRTGFAIWLKKLEKRKYPWPKDKEQHKELSVAELKMLLAGIDFWKAHESLTYKKII
jgi:transposase